MSGPHPRPPLLPEGFGFPAGFAAAALVTAAAVACGAREHPALSLAGLTCVVLATAVTSTLPAAAGTAVAAWALHTGFVVGRFGALSFTRAGLVTGLVLALTAALAAAARAAPPLRSQRGGRSSATRTAIGEAPTADHLPDRPCGSRTARPPTRASTGRGEATPPVGTMKDRQCGGRSPPGGGAQRSAPSFPRNSRMASRRAAGSPATGCARGGWRARRRGATGDRPGE
jgi:hypothetical protein